MRVGLFGGFREEFMISWEVDELFAAGAFNICSDFWVPAAVEAEYSGEFNKNLLPGFVFLL